MENIFQSAGVRCQSQPVHTQCCGWSSPCGSYYECKTPFSNHHQETLKKKQKVCYLQALEIQSTPGATQQGER